MGIKMGPRYVNLFVGYIQLRTNFSTNSTDLNLNYSVATSTTALAQLRISSTREELEQFINSVNSSHRALKYTLQISETSTAFLDINVSIDNNSLLTIVYHKPTDSHSYLLHSSPHPTHVKNSIPFSHFLRLRHLCSDEFDFSSKSEEMLHFFNNRGYSDSVVKTNSTTRSNKRPTVSATNVTKG